MFKKRDEKLTNIRNETGATTTDPADIKRIIREYFTLLCTQKFDNLDEVN